MKVDGQILDSRGNEAGDFDLDPQPFELVATLRRVHEHFRERAAGKGLDYRLLLSPRLPPRVRGDAARLQQLLGKLVSGAIESTIEGTVWLDAASTPTSSGLHLLTLRVGDSGCGIGGNREGLAASQQLAELMDGFIELRGHPGEGSVFTVHLPLPEARELPEPRRRVPRAESTR